MKKIKVLGRRVRFLSGAKFREGTVVWTSKLGSNLIEILPDGSDVTIHTTVWRLLD